MPDEAINPGTDMSALGQAAEGPETATLDAPETPDVGQPAAPDTPETTDTGTQESAEIETFFDPEAIKDDPNLMAAYKQMQGAFTKKTQGIKDHQQKIEAYDAFYQNPLAGLQQMVGQLTPQQLTEMGLTRAQAQEAAQSAELFGGGEPQSWEQVMAVAEERAEQRVMQRISPYLAKVQEYQKGTIESKLDADMPGWREYEDQMASTLQRHPTMADDPAMLARMSLPPEVLEARATQAALKKLEAKGQSAKVAGQSTTTKQPSTGPPGNLTFEESVAWAKGHLAAKG